MNPRYENVAHLSQECPALLSSLLLLGGCFRLTSFTRYPSRFSQQIKSTIFWLNSFLGSHCRFLIQRPRLLSCLTCENNNPAAFHRTPYIRASKRLAKHTLNQLYGCISPMRNIHERAKRFKKPSLDPALIQPVAIVLLDSLFARPRWI